MLLRSTETSEVNTTPIDTLKLIFIEYSNNQNLIHDDSHEMNFNSL